MNPRQLILSDLAFTHYRLTFSTLSRAARAAAESRLRKLYGELQQLQNTII